MSESLRIVVTLPVWLVVVLVALMVINTALGIRAAYWDRRLRKESWRAELLERQTETLTRFGEAADARLRDDDARRTAEEASLRG